MGHNYCKNLGYAQPHGVTLYEQVCNNKFEIDILKDERLINTVTQYDLIIDLPELENGLLAYVKENKGLYIGDDGNILLNESQPLELKNFVNVQDFGAVGDGVTDDSDKIQDAIDDLVSQGGGILYFPTATYVVKQTINLKGNIIVELNNSTIDGSTLNVEIFTCEGSKESDIALLSDSLTRSKQITLNSVSGLNVGDYLLIKSSRVTGSTNQKQGQFIRISNIAGTVVDIETELQDDYLVAENAVINKMNFEENIHVTNGTFIGSDDISDLTIGVRYFNVSNATVTNCKFIKTQYIGVSLFDSRNIVIDSCDFIDIESVGLAYGVSCIYNTEDVYINNCFGVNHRHLTTTGGGTTSFGIPKNIVVTNCVARGMKDAGFDSHPGARNVQIKGCTVDGSLQDGITLQADSFICENNTILNCSRHGILVQNLSVKPLKGNISGNKIINVTSNGVSIGLDDVYKNIDSLVINDNYIENAGGSGIIQPSGLSVIEDKNIKILGNTLKNITNHAIYVRTMDGINISDNLITGDMTTGIYLLTGSKCIVKGNKLDDLTALGIRVATGLDNIITNNIIAGSDAVDLSVGSDYNIVTNNNVRQSVSGIDDNGLNNIVANNVV